jgi:archaellum biogenesis ATPase FlaH
MICEIDKELFRYGISNGNLIEAILKYDIIENPKIKGTLQDIQPLFKETNTIPDLSLYKDRFDCEDSAILFTTLDLNESTLFKFNELIRHSSKKKFIDRLLEFDISGTPIEFDDIARIWKDNIFEYKNVVEERLSITCAKDIYKLRERLKEQLGHTIPTGFLKLDDVLSGGWRLQNIFCFVGLTGTGKSIWLANIAGRLWLASIKILFITTEMNDVEVYDRILRSAYGASNLEDAAVKALRHFPAPSLLTVIKVEPDAIDATFIQTEINKMEWKPDVVIIDYFDELNSTIREKEEYNKHGVVASDLKKLAERNNCAIVTATQANRSAASDKGGTKGDLGLAVTADSSKKLRNLQACFIIKQTAKDKDQGKISLKVGKNRFGDTPSKHLDFTINYNTMRIDDGFRIPDSFVEDEDDGKIGIDKKGKFVCK